MKKEKLGYFLKEKAIIVKITLKIRIIIVAFPCENSSSKREWWIWFLSGVNGEIPFKILIVKTLKVSMTG